jgi:anti-anti-sigma factor
LINGFSMSLQTESRSEAFIVRPHGLLSMEVAHEMEELLEIAFSDGLRKVVFDFSELTMISSDGLRVILKSLRRLRELDGNAVLAGAGEQVRSVLAAGGFFALLDEFESVEAALGLPTDDDSAL